MTPFLAWFGRRNTLLVGSFGLLLGGILQTISQTIVIIYVGRIISGMGLGASSLAGVIYLAEVVNKEHRTASVGSVQVAPIIGALLSYWIGYGVDKDAPSTFQWRFLLGFQVILACAHCFGLLFIPESPRFLATVHVKQEAKRRQQGLPALPRFPGASHKHNSNLNDKADQDSKSVASQAAVDTLDSPPSHANIAHTLADRIFLGRTAPATTLSTLAYLRRLPISDEIVLNECAEIYAAVDEAQAVRDADGGLKHLVFHKKGSILRLCIAAWLGIWNANTGQLILLSYAPTVLKSIGLSNTSISLVASGGWTTWELVCVIIGVYYGLNKVGRVTAIAFGGISLGIIFFMLAAIEGTHPINPLAASPSKASYGMVFLIYLFVPFFIMSLGPATWIYASEICTGGLRELGQGIFIVVAWVFVVIGAKTTPLGILALGWKFWFVPAVCNTVFGVAAWFIMPETHGKTIEQIDAVFGALDQEAREIHIQQVLRDEKAAVIQSA
ncbi:hypothetical protein FRB96_004265 [Tulasnella sp. 330]|nr:hypothetical protein FRB96_004265 [Tulasnella sp. 330]